MMKPNDSDKIENATMSPGVKTGRRPSPAAKEEEAHDVLWGKPTKEAIFVAKQRAATGDNKNTTGYGKTNISTS